MSSIPSSFGKRSFSFRDALQGFLLHNDLPFASLLDDGRIREVFQKHSSLSGGIFTTAIALWAFLSQVLRDDKEASCQSAVARISAYLIRVGKKPPSADTGDYCRARAKLSEFALKQICIEVAQDTQTQSNPEWLRKTRDSYLVDGFTFQMPDTPENQKAYPQHMAQKPGLGFPIARVTSLISLATGTVTDAALGPYKGKGTGETGVSMDEIAELYGFRRNIKLDIRSIKSHMNLSHVRCKSPEMVRREFWTTLLAYNLIRTTIALAANLYGKEPRRISFVSAWQYVLASWQEALYIKDASRLEDYCRQMLKAISQCKVGNRPGRFEPRVVKRRRDQYKKMMKPRNELRKSLQRNDNSFE